MRRVGVIADLRIPTDQPLRYSLASSGTQTIETPAGVQETEYSSEAGILLGLAPRSRLGANSR
jgi:hypothetical protein